MFQKWLANQPDPTVCHILLQNVGIRTEDTVWEELLTHPGFQTKLTNERKAWVMAGKPYVHQPTAIFGETKDLSERPSSRRSKLLLSLSSTSRIRVPEGRSSSKLAQIGNGECAVIAINRITALSEELWARCQLATSF